MCEVNPNLFIYSFAFLLWYIIKNIMALVRQVSSISIHTNLFLLPYPIKKRSIRGRTPDVRAIFQAGTNKTSIKFE